MIDDTILSPCPRAIDPRDAEALAEIERLRARIAELEERQGDLLAAYYEGQAVYAAAIARGTLAAPTPDDEPATYTHDVPPNAPR